MTTETRISHWLLLCCFMVFAMAVIGAVTRLTESGLSITEWKPVAGALPPLSESAWQHQFDLYKQTPEYSAKHFWMQLDDFKKIFFWEWLHRLWGRAIGIVYALPLTDSTGNGLEIHWPSCAGRVTGFCRLVHG